MTVTVFPLQQCLNERESMLCYTRISCLLTAIISSFTFKKLHEKSKFLVNKGRGNRKYFRPFRCTSLSDQDSTSLLTFTQCTSYSIHKVKCTRCLYNLLSTDNLNKISSTGCLRLRCTWCTQIWFFISCVKSVCKGFLGCVCPTLFVTPSCLAR